MLGTVLAMVNTSACRPMPRAAASRMPRTKPLSREKIVPAAITALDDSSDRDRSEALMRPSPGGPAPAVLAHPQHDPAHDHHREQQAAGGDHDPDDDADLAGPQREGE